MFVFHTTYDLNLFNLISVDFFNDPFWFYLPRLIVALFLTATGMSLVVAHQNGTDYQKFFKRFFKIIFFSALISLFTYLFFRARWIYFGTLHCIAICSLVSILFINRPKLSLFFSLLVIFVMNFYHINTQTFSRLIDHPSMDFIPPFPWMGFVWFGIFLAHQSISNIKINFYSFTKVISFFNRHSLWIYLIHQPIIFGIVYLIHYIAKSPSV